jgi:hypothetical protein
MMMMLGIIDYEGDDDNNGHYNGDDSDDDDDDDDLSLILINFPKNYLKCKGKFGDPKMNTSETEWERKNSLRVRGV